MRTSLRSVLVSSERIVFKYVASLRDFFFQAEDGIRYYKVTGVQTCALPICHSRRCFDRFCQALSPRLVQRDRRRFVRAAQMTTTQTGGTEYDARMGRAERLAAQLFFATEFLEFYKHIAAFQKKLRAKIAESSGAQSRGAPGTEL